MYFWLCVLICAHMYGWTCMWRREFNVGCGCLLLSSVTLNLIFYFLFFETLSSLNLVLFLLDWLATQPRDAPLLPPQTPSLQACVVLLQLFMWVLGILRQVLMLAKQNLYSLSDLTIPVTWVFLMLSGSKKEWPYTNTHPPPTHPHTHTHKGAGSVLFWGEQHRPLSRPF